VNFFEPLPERNDVELPPWRPPLWDRPSEGTLSACVPVGEIVSRDDTLVVSVDHLRVLPNGFVIDFLAMRHPDEAQRDHLRPTFFGPGSWPRVGVMFADGRAAGRDAPGYGVFDVPKDGAGIPTVPILTHTGGGGGGSEYHLRVWVFPLPPEGPLSIYVQLGGLPEGHTTIDGALIREAAERARVIWS
jgi:hypothetical protein